MGVCVCPFIERLTYLRLSFMNTEDMNSKHLIKLFFCGCTYEMQGSLVFATTRFHYTVCLIYFHKMSNHSSSDYLIQQEMHSTVRQCVRPHLPNCPHQPHTLGAPAEERQIVHNPITGMTGLIYGAQ